MGIVKIIMMTHKWLRMSNQHSPNISVLSWLQAVNACSKWHFPELKASNLAIVLRSQVCCCCCSLSNSLRPHQSKQRPRGPETQTRGPPHHLG